MDFSRVSFLEIEGAPPRVLIETIVSGNLAFHRHKTDWDRNLKGALANFYRQVRWALERRRGVSSDLLDDRYPLQAARSLLRVLGWKELGELGRSMVAGPRGQTPAPLKMSMSGETFVLLPELLPIEETTPRRWLDSMGPIAWKVDQRCPERPAPPAEPRRLAIIFQVDDAIDFEHYAESLKEKLRGSLIVSTYSGRQFPTNPHARDHLLQKIFYRNQAVIFLGHLSESENENERGWCLALDNVLRMTELMRFFGVSAVRGRLEPPAATGLPMPEVIFANCCASAGRDGAPPGEYALCYPHLFLAAGTRFFIGSTIKVIFESRDVGEVIELAAQFFGRWAADPEGAASHLYAAKRAGGFSLRTSLYRIYCAGEDEGPPPAPAAAAPGDRLGEYRLERELWTDAAGRTFAARRGDGGFCLIQVLADKLQFSAGITQDLNGAIGRLKEAGLDGRHLVPSRQEYLALLKEGSPCGCQRVLVFDRPGAEDPDQWGPLERPPPDLDSALAAWVMKRARELSLALAELHACGLAHGNLRPESLVVRAEGSRRVLLLKDTWLFQVRREAGDPARGDAAKTQCREDMRQLGLLLRGWIGDSDRAPEPLARLIRDCLSPHPPSAAQVVRALEMDLSTGSCSCARCAGFQPASSRVQAGCLRYSD